MTDGKFALGCVTGRHDRWVFAVGHVHFQILTLVMSGCRSASGYVQAGELLRQLTVWTVVPMLSRFLQNGPRDNEGIGLNLSFILKVECGVVQDLLIIELDCCRSVKIVLRHDASLPCDFECCEGEATCGNGVTL